MIQAQNKSTDWGAKQIITVVVIGCLAAYIIIFLTWNFTNSDPNHKPSGLLWDIRKDGYKEDPLYDRYENQNKK